MCPRSRGAFRPRLLAFSPSQINRGRREDRVTAAPGALAPEKLREGRVTTGTADITPAFPAQWFTAYSALSSVSQCLFATVASQHTFGACAKLDASVGASGPHGFAVRVCAARQSAHPRPPHPALHVRDVRERPSSIEAGCRDHNRN